MNKFGTRKAAVVMLWFSKGPRSTNKIMLSKRLKVPYFSGWWAATGGKVDDGECAIQAAKREVLEETGLYVSAENLSLMDCYVAENFKCFMLETILPMYRFEDVKNTEPSKHSPWQLFTIREALKLPKLMPALQETLLTKLQERTMIIS